jgi:hypothetical protein
MNEGFVEGEVVNKSIRVDKVGQLRWQCRDGKIIVLKEMEDRHLRNASLVLMGLGYVEISIPDKIRVMWLSALRTEWERRMIEKHNKTRVWTVSDDAKSKLLHGDWETLDDYME